MTPPRISIARAMVAVMAVAANCGVLRQFIADDLPAAFQAAGALLMINVLAAGMYGIISRLGKREPFLVGFEITGLVAMLAYFGCGRMIFSRSFVDSFWNLEVVAPVYEFCKDWLLPVAFLALVFGLPQLLIALAGGLLARRVFGSPRLREPDYPLHLPLLTSGPASECPQSDS